MINKNMCLAFKKTLRSFGLLGLSVLLSISLMLFFPSFKQPVLADPGSDAKAQLEALAPEFNELSNNVIEAENEYYDAVAQAEEAQNNINMYQNKIDESIGIINNMAVNSYKNGGPLSEIEILVGSTDLQSFISSFEAINTVNHKKLSLVNEFTFNKKMLEDSYQSLQQNVDVAAAKKDEAESAKSVIENRIASLNEIISREEAERQAAAARARQIS